MLGAIAVLISAEDGGRPADRAGMNGKRWIVRPVGDFQHLRDDFPGLVDEDFIAYGDAAQCRFHIAHVVQGRSGDRGSGQLNRVEHGNRRDDAGASGLQNDVRQGCLFLLRRILVGHRPAGELAGLAHLGVVVHTVELDDGAVDGIALFASAMVDVVDGGDDFLIDAFPEVVPGGKRRHGVVKAVFAPFVVAGAVAVIIRDDFEAVGLEPAEVRLLRLPERGAFGV